MISAAEIIHSTPKAAAAATGSGAGAGTICCAEVIHGDTVAVACSDGLLRLWVSGRPRSLTALPSHLLCS